MALGLSVSEYIVFFAGVLLMFLVSMAGRGKSVREQIAKLPYEELLPALLKRIEEM